MLVCFLLAAVIEEAGHHLTTVSPLYSLYLCIHCVVTNVLRLHKRIIRALLSLKPSKTKGHLSRRLNPTVKFFSFDSPVDGGSSCGAFRHLPLAKTKSGDG